MGRKEKGKKAWRKNIDATEVEDFIEKSTYQERRGPAVDSLKDEQLFFVDTNANQQEAEAVVEGRKRKRVEIKPLRSALILQAAHQASPVVRPPPRKPVGQLTKKNTQNSSQHQKQQVVAAKPQPEAGHPLDIWGDDFGMADGSAAKRGKVRVGVKGAAPLVKPVEIDMAGCSYNPDFDSHQEAIAQLVAEENKKLLKAELGPAPIPLIPAPEGGMDELEQLIVDADTDDEVEDKDANEINLEGEDDPRATSKTMHKKTKKDRNKEKRRQEEERRLQEKKRVKQQRKDIDHLRLLQEELEEQEKQKELRRQRQAVVAAEKAVSQPPRLGKLRFEPMSTQVLTTDEIDGSLRRIKACPVLALDRFKSMQKRGLIEVRKPQGQKSRGHKVEYQTGDRTERAMEGQAELDALRKARKHLKR